MSTRRAARRRAARGGTASGGGEGIAGLVGDAVLVAGSRLVEAMMQRRGARRGAATPRPAAPGIGPATGPATAPATAPQDVLERLLRATALGAVLLVSRRVTSLTRLPLRRRGS